MDLEYDVFEVLDNGTSVWRCFVHGLNEARATVNRLASQSANEFFAIHTPTKEIVARARGQGPQKKAAKHSTGV